MNKLPYVTFNDQAKLNTYYDVSIYRNFYQKWFINEYARKKKAKISGSQSSGVTEFFLVRYITTYVLKITDLKKNNLLFYNSYQ